MENKQFYINTLNEIKRTADDIMAQWSGDEGDKMEENAHISRDIIEKCEEIINLIETYN